MKSVIIVRVSDENVFETGLIGWISSMKSNIFHHRKDTWLRIYLEKSYSVPVAVVLKYYFISDIFKFYIPCLVSLLDNGIRP